MEITAVRVGPPATNRRVARAAADAGEVVLSIVTGLLVLPDDAVVYPGHGEATTIGREKATNPFFV